MLYLLLASGALCLAGAWLSFSESGKSPFLVPVMAILGAWASIVWAWAVIIEPDKEKLYEFAVWWDVMTVGIYYLLPLIFLGVRPNAGVVVGACIVAVGLVVVKVYS